MKALACHGYRCSLAWHTEMLNSFVTSSMPIPSESESANVLAQHSWKVRGVAVHQLLSDPMG
jgi:hypothetical protein